MPFFTTSLRWAIQASVLFLSATVVAQNCFYPDGSLSKDTPCSSAGHSSCCGADSFCLSNGLCYGGGMISRGSCTDKSWDSDVCAGYCRKESPDAGITITPCANDGDNSTFTCGLSNGGCQDKDRTWTLHGGDSLVLRPSQVADIIHSSTSQEVATSSSAATNGTTMYTSSQMAGLGCGLGLPLAFFLVVALCMLHKEKQKHAGPKLMYKLPDNHEEFTNTFRQPPPALRSHTNMSIDTQRTGAYSAYGLQRGDSVLTVDSARPAHMHSFLDPYSSINRDGKGAQTVVHEMDGVSPHEPSVRFELSDKRFSTPTGN